MQHGTFRHNGRVGATVCRLAVLAFFLGVFPGGHLLLRADEDAPKSKGKTGSMKRPAPSKAAKSKLTKAAANSAKDAATLDEAVKVLDLRRFELPKGSVIEDDPNRRVDKIEYLSKGSPPEAYRALQQQFKKLGWKEMPGADVQETHVYGQFQKAKFIVAIQVSEWKMPDGSRMQLAFHGNVSALDLPVVKGAQVGSYAKALAVSYVTTTPPADVVIATRKLFLDAGWEPYGSSEISEEHTLLRFKRNAILINAGVAKSKTFREEMPYVTEISYNVHLLAADLPTPANAEDIDFAEVLKTLKYKTPDDFATLAKFYLEKLKEQGWTPKTENFEATTNLLEGTPAGSLTFYNSAKDRITLWMDQLENKSTKVYMKHYTAAEAAADDKAFGR